MYTVQAEAYRACCTQFTLGKLSLASTCSFARRQEVLNDAQRERLQDIGVIAKQRRSERIARVGCTRTMRQWPVHAQSATKSACEQDVGLTRKPQG